ncbi:MAG: EAL domain-containing protein [Pseudomonadota bacterium]
MAQPQPFAQSITLPDGHFSAQFLEVNLHSAFQPIFRLANDEPKLFACEGLARPFVDGRPLTPYQFFSKLKTDELVEVEQILRQLHLRNARSLPERARRLFLNFDPGAMRSMRDITPEIDLVSREMRASGLQPNDIICEIVEHAAYDSAVMKEFVYAMRARGFIIAVDDYGSDHADAARVKSLVPDIVKMEGKVVRSRMATPEGFALLVDQIRTFSKDGILTLLEGLETPWHLELALKSGAAYAQGFILGMPQIVPCDFSDWTQPNKQDQDTEDAPRLVKFFR